MRIRSLSIPVVIWLVNLTRQISWAEIPKFPIPSSKTHSKSIISFYNFDIHVIVFADDDKLTDFKSQMLNSGSGWLDGNGILSDLQVSLVENTSFEIDKILYSLVQSDMKGFSRRLRSGLVVYPANTDDFENFSDMISDFYYSPKRGVSIDRQLVIIIMWPAFITIEEKNGDWLENFRLVAENISLYFPLDSQVYVITHFDSDANNKSVLPSSDNNFLNYIVWEIYSVKDIGIVRQVDHVIGQVSTSSDDSIVRSSNNFILNSDWYLILLSMPQRRRNFQAASIVATSVGIDTEINDPIAKFSDQEVQNDTDSNGTEISRLEFSGGCAVSIFKDLASILNFTIVAERSWSYMAEFNNGTMTGDGKLLMEGKADISIYLSYVVYGRGELLQPLASVTMDRIQALFRQPEIQSIRNIFTEPFSTNLWMAILTMYAVFFATIISVSFTIRWFQCAPRSRHNQDPDFNALDALLFIISSTCQRGYALKSKQWTVRIVIFTTLFFSVILYTAYSASIVSAFAVSEPPIKTIKDILLQNFKILADPNVNYADYLFKSKKKQEEYSKKFASDFTNDEDAVLKVYEGNHAYLSTTDIIGPVSRSLNYTDAVFCSTISTITLQYVTMYSGFYVRKGSPFKEHFNTRLVELMQKGLVAKYVRNLYAVTKPRCGYNYGPASYHFLSLVDVTSAFTLLAIGIFLGLIVLNFEVLSTCDLKYFYKKYNQYFKVYVIAKT